MQEKSYVWVRRAGLGMVLLIPCFGQQNPPSQGRDIPKLYASSCAGCHGAELLGGNAPSLIDGTRRQGNGDAGLSRSIEQHPQAGLAAIQPALNKAEIRGLVIYIHERSALQEREHTKFNSPAIGAIVQGKNAAFSLEPVVDAGLKEPWAIAFLPDGRMLVTERPGRLRIVAGGHLLPEAISGVPAVYGGEGGLLDVALHPRYAQPGHDWIYLSYGDKNPDGLALTAVIRGRLRNGALVEQQQIFKADAALYRPGGQRFGSKLLFDAQEHLFFSVGDRAHPGDEQELSHPNGKLHRVNEDGSIPTDNPFAHQSGAMASVWSYGHRNPQGLAFSPVTGELWEAEHGPRGGDELNVIVRGHNYGWPLITYGMNYDGTPITAETSHAGMDQPVTYWVPSIATSAIAFYTGKQFPKWKNNLFIGSLAAQELRRLTIEGRVVQEQEILFKGVGRVRDVVNGPDGCLYVVLNQPDLILRLAPAAADR